MHAAKVFSQWPRHLTLTCNDYNSEQKTASF